MSADKTAVVRGEEALEAMVAEGKKVTMNSVANRAGFSHANFRYAEFADLKDDIEKAAAKQAQEKLSNNVDALKKQVLELKAQLKAAKQKVESSSGSETVALEGLMVKLTECYRLNDKQKAEIADLKNQLLHNMGHEEQVISFDENTGEITSGLYRK